MPRLDATRIALWRQMQCLTAAIERAIDADLRAEWDIGLGWFDVLAALQRHNGMARPSELAADLTVVASSLTRRLDRLEEEGWIKRHTGRGDDQRSVTIELTKRGRNLWREMNVTYRRSLQAHVAGALSDDDVAAAAGVLDTIAARLRPVDATPHD